MPGSRSAYLPQSARSEVLVLETEPLNHDVTVMAPVQIHLFSAPNCQDTDFNAKLIDVYPPSTYFPGGSAMQLTDGIRCARYRDGRRHGELLTPDKVYAFDSNPFDMANDLLRRSVSVSAEAVVSIKRDVRR